MLQIYVLWIYLCNKRNPFGSLSLDAEKRNREILRILSLITWMNRGVSAFSSFLNF